MTFIETQDLCRQRGGRTTLKNVCLKVTRGEVFALIGPTGAGKTTLLRLIDLLDKPASGKILFDGTEVAAAEKPRLQIRRRVAFVLQKPVVFNASVQENVACGLRWRGLDRHRLHEMVNQTLETVGLTDYRHRNARTLSGGEMQRVAIARAIVTRPELLLLDEPTANLDPVSAARIEELLTGIIKSDVITVIMATHDMAQGQRLADRMAVLVDGEVLQTGRAQDIFATPSNRYVAEFVGMKNILDGVITASEDKLAAIDVHGQIIEAVTDFAAGEAVSVGIRPEDITLAPAKSSSSARNTLAGEVSWVGSAGPLSRIGLDCGFLLVALVTRRSAEELGLAKGVKIYATFKATSLHVMKR